LEDQGISPHSRHIKGSNVCKIALFEDRRPGWVIIISVIDNLTKGSAGQALQNYNLTQGWVETLGSLKYIYVSLVIYRFISLCTCVINKALSVKKMQYDSIF
jgi:N-acetyl-gamma-glutamylphosphate reductase